MRIETRNSICSSFGSATYNSHTTRCPSRFNSSERYAETRHLRDLDNNSSRKGSLLAHGIGHSDFGRLVLRMWCPLLDVGSAHIIEGKGLRASRHAASKVYKRNWFIFVEHYDFFHGELPNAFCRGLSLVCGMTFTQWNGTRESFSFYSRWNMYKRDPQRCISLQLSFHSSSIQLRNGYLSLLRPHRICCLRCSTRLRRRCT